ncbi:UDP-N-acetylmuramate--L-alanine ligase [Pseudobacteriovorax antillogorgiicola]|uniref:UDP-N-acetylmuramate--L-alanine ligase n=1 Tax=Pseudobacteriovorax antillogorgiicola TaxID=1513793 RepID=A0A1Y6B8N8_9BACT|nr:Mur ligase family protein [Pseudobacteriovorax antillogorgiicola]TCS59239.1 UDP-N-acetylmuramate--L-alanine ligase [Pseudobacteriovorax antillogorgiicola]SME90261.1 UDP-N-acetylmuramate--L-alanine ligase [Pseudobacteriovorax antillogorgiicola]
MKLSSNAQLYFIGIGGTGMASTAGLAQEAGFQVSGSDANLYPPMSTLLDDLKIPVRTPYSKDNINGLKTDMVIIANALSRGHEELEEILSQGFPYTSFPEFLGEMILKQRQSIVVAGTHGKTTTTSMMAHVLRSLGHDPGYLIGGIPKNFSKSFHLGSDAPFVIEGDEYDTAFFDKNSKFLHYYPKFLIFNNLEFDHADIFKDLAAIEHQFDLLFDRMDNKKNVLANWDDPGVRNFLETRKLAHEVTRVSTVGENADCDFHLEDVIPGQKSWRAVVKTPRWGQLNFETSAIGQHNIANFTQVVACIDRLVSAQVIPEPDSLSLSQSIASFEGVQRRLDHLASVNDIEIYEDFAHHPTAVALVLQTFKRSYPDRRLFVAFEPRNATSRRNIFTKRYAEALNIADQVLLGYCPVDKRIPEELRMNTAVIAESIGSKAEFFESNEDLLNSLVAKMKPKDAIIFMSSGSFSGIQYKLANRLSV